MAHLISQSDPKFRCPLCGTEFEWQEGDPTVRHGASSIGRLELGGLDIGPAIACETEIVDD